MNFYKPNARISIELLLRRTLVRLVRYAAIRASFAVSLPHCAINIAQWALDENQPVKNFYMAYNCRNTTVSCYFFPQ